MRILRHITGRGAMVDTRKQYLFLLPDGREVGTKATSREEAHSIIITCLNLEDELQEVNSGMEEK